MLRNKLVVGIILTILVSCYVPKEDDSGVENAQPDRVNISFLLNGQWFEERKEKDPSKELGFEIFDAQSLNEAGLSAEGLLNNEVNYGLECYWPKQATGAFQVAGPVNYDGISYQGFLLSLRPASVLPGDSIVFQYFEAVNLNLVVTEYRPFEKMKTALEFSGTVRDQDTNEILEITEGTIRAN